MRTAIEWITAKMQLSGKRLYQSKLSFVAAIKAEDNQVRRKGENCNKLRE